MARGREMQDRTKTTQAQIEMCVELINKTKFDLDWLDLDKMSRSQMARLIDKLRDVERGLDNA